MYYGCLAEGPISNINKKIPSKIENAIIKIINKKIRLRKMNNNDIDKIKIEINKFNYKERQYISNKYDEILIHFKNIYYNKIIIKN